MASFEEGYQRVFQNFGSPLRPKTAMGESTLAKAEKRLGVPIPVALRAYYLIAGRERRFNLSCERLLPPTEWEIDSKRLVFMAEDQDVCSWGVSVGIPDSDDPPVSEGHSDDESTAWYPLRRKCSVFLMAVLHHQALYGGLPYLCFGSTIPSKILRERFRKREWTSYGELKGETYYSRPNQVLCLSREAPENPEWTISIGAKTQRDLKALGNELGLSVE